MLFSAFFLSIASPGFMSERGIWILAFFALIPLFAVVRNTSWKVVGGYGFLFGFVYYIFFAYWLKGFHALAILLIPIINGLETLVLFFALKAADSFFRRYGWVVQSVIWVAYEYLSESWFAGFSYGNIAYAFYRMTPFVQIADITGLWGIVFLAILPQAFLGRYLADYARGNDPGFRSYVMKLVIVTVVSTASMTLNAYRGLTELKPFALDLMKSYAANKMTVLFYLRAPNSLPFIFISLKVSVPACVIAALVSEYFAERITGVGRRIRECILQAQYSTAWAYIVTACIIGIVLFAILMASEKLIMRKRNS